MLQGRLIQAGMPSDGYPNYNHSHAGGHDPAGSAGSARKISRHLGPREREDCFLCDALGQDGTPNESFSAQSSSDSVPHFVMTWQPSAADALFPGHQRSRVPIIQSPDTMLT